MGDSSKFHGKTISCPCGNQFYATLGQIASGRKRYCSKECKYKFRKRPSGLQYSLKVVNPTWFVHGERASPTYHPPKGFRASPATEFKKGCVPANFKGDAVGYGGLHSWVRRNLGPATKCCHCGKQGRMHWANISWEYKREKDDWMQLCPKCHQRYDRAGGWGIATQKFGLRA